MTRYRNLPANNWIVLLSCLWTSYNGARAFVVRPIVRSAISGSLSLGAHHLDPADVVTKVATLDQAPSLIVSSVLDIIQTVAIVVGGIIAVILALTVVFSTFVIPGAAKQLEESIRELDPELWNEYASKMEPGETLAMRPDLMQELGRKMNKRITEKMEQKMAEGRTASTTQSTTDGSGATTDQTAKIIDVEVLPPDDKESWK